MKAKPEVIELDIQKLDTLLQTIRANLGEEVAGPFRDLVDGYTWLLEIIDHQEMTLRRLRQIVFGAKTERTRNVLGSRIASGRRGNYMAFQAAQGDVVYHDDTTGRILELMDQKTRHQAMRDDDPDRRGIFTSCILSTGNGHSIALYFTGPRHAGENLRAVLFERAEGLPPPIQMCDALSRNMSEDLRTIVANCLSHGRRRFVEVAEAFPPEVTYVLEALKQVYQVDAEAKGQQLSAEQRLRLHQERSRPVMDALHQWMKEQLEQRKVEPNSSLGAAIAYMLKHWEKLALFLRQPGAPLDNNLCEQALKKAILHRKNSLFYKTRRGWR